MAWIHGSQGLLCSRQVNLAITTPASVTGRGSVSGHRSSYETPGHVTYQTATSEEPVTSREIRLNECDADPGVRPVSLLGLGSWSMPLPVTLTASSSAVLNVIRVSSVSPLSIVRLLMSTRREIFDGRHAVVRSFTRKQLRVIHLLKFLPHTRLRLLERGFHPVVRRT